jgi:hypothetical protein
MLTDLHSCPARNPFTVRAVLDGPLAAVAVLLYGRHTQRGFEAVCAALKGRAGAAL